MSMIALHRSRFLFLALILLVGLVALLLLTHTGYIPTHPIMSSPPVPNITYGNG